MSDSDDNIQSPVSVARIVVTSDDGRSDGEYALTKRQMMIGRRMDCDIRINSKNASRHHAQIFKVLSDDYILDLDSKNGTFVNAKRVKKHSLEHGDIITIGGVRMEYFAGD